MNKEMQEFALRFAWSAIFWSMIDEYALISDHVDQMPLEEMKTDLEELNLDQESPGTDYARLRFLRNQWIEAYMQFVTAN